MKQLYGFSLIRYYAWSDDGLNRRPNTSNHCINITGVVAWRYIRWIYRLTCTLRKCHLKIMQWISCSTMWFINPDLKLCSGSAVQLCGLSTLTSYLCWKKRIKAQKFQTMCYLTRHRWIRRAFAFVLCANTSEPSNSDNVYIFLKCWISDLDLPKERPTDMQQVMSDTVPRYRPLLSDIYRT